MKSFKKPWFLLAILLSLTTPLGVEAIRVVQFGRNYSSWLVGIIFLICVGLSEFKNDIEKSHSKTYKNVFISLLGVFLISHAIFNARLFFLDVFPSRMATTYIYQWTLGHRTNELSTYRNHPRHLNMIEFLNNPSVRNKVYLWPIDTIAKVKKGYIFIPTITGKTIWCECREGDFKGDPYLTELYNSGEFSKYVVATFKTLSSSKIWTQEEEICTYRNLIVGDISDEDRQKGLAWILDADKLQREWFPEHPLKTTEP